MDCAHSGQQALQHALVGQQALHHVLVLPSGPDSARISLQRSSATLEWNVVAALARVSRGSRAGNCAERGVLAPRRASVLSHVEEVPQEMRSPSLEDIDDAASGLRNPMLYAAVHGGPGELTTYI